MTTMNPICPPGLILKPGCSFGNFEIIRFLGGGATSEVYLAADNLERKVALKILNPKEASIDDTFRKRFIREGIIIGRLNHENIVQIYSAGKIDDLEYISQEFIDGKTLNDKLVGKKNPSEGAPEPFLPSQALEMLIPLVDGIRYLHSQGIVHRDLKPKNIIIPVKGGLKIIDFGIAKVINKEDQTLLTKDYTAVGTLAYMSPEQLKHEPVTEQADLWASGCIAYEMLTLKSPFKYSEMDNLATRVIAINEKNFESIEEFNPFLKKRGSGGKSLESIIRRVLDPDIEERYSSADELYQDLLACGRGKPVGVKGNYRRRLGMTRREFTKKIIMTGIMTGLAGAALVAAGVGANALVTQSKKKHVALLTSNTSELRKEFEYKRSIYAVIDEIGKPEVNSFAKLYGLLGELEPRLFERLEWLNDAVLVPQQIYEKGKTHPSIYPLCSVTTPGRQGEWTFLTGESAVAGTLCSLVYSIFSDLYQRSASEKSTEKRQKLREKGIKALDDFFYYSKNLYFAENLDKNTDILSPDEKSRAVNRFHAPATDVLVRLKKQHPEIFSRRKNEISIIVSNYAKAVKIAIEKIVPYTISNLDRFGSWRDSDITLMLCDAPRLLDIKKQVLNQHSEYGSRVRSVQDYLDMIISEADIKISRLASSAGWKSKAASKDYTSLMLGTAYRRNLLKDIINILEFGYPDNNILYQNSAQLSPAYVSYLSSKAGEYDAVLQEMAGYFFPRLFLTDRSNYYLSQNQKPENPVDIIPMAEALQFLSSYRSRIKSINLSGNEAQFRILKSLLSHEFVSGSNKLPPSIENPLGFFRNTVIRIDNPSSRGGTYIETDKILLDVIGSIAR